MKIVKFKLMVNPDGAFSIISEPEGLNEFNTIHLNNPNRDAIKFTECMNSVKVGDCIEIKVIKKDERR